MKGESGGGQEMGRFRLKDIDVKSYPQYGRFIEHIVKKQFEIASHLKIFP